MISRRELLERLGAVLAVGAVSGMPTASAVDVNDPITPLPQNANDGYWFRVIAWDFTTTVTEVRLAEPDRIDVTTLGSAHSEEFPCRGQQFFATLSDCPPLDMFGTEVDVEFSCGNGACYYITAALVECKSEIDVDGPAKHHTKWLVDSHEQGFILRNRT